MHVTFEAKYLYQMATLYKWWGMKVELAKFVATRRLGLRGLRPWGSHKPLAHFLPGQGARLSKLLPENNKSQQLLQCFLKVRVWFENERRFNTEVRQRHIVQRLKFQMEFEKDRQVVLHQQKRNLFKIWYMKALEHRLQHFQIHNQTKAQKGWFNYRVCPHLGATPRNSQRKSEKSTRGDEQKFHLTVQGVDYAIDLVAIGTPEQLIAFVADPEDFIEHRKETKIVVLDETALWLKCRGEEQVYQSAIEILKAAKRRSVRTACKLAETKEAKDKAKDHFENWCEDNIC